MRIVITGASGVLGTACCSVYSGLGHEVLTLSHKDLLFFCAESVRNKIIGADCVIHAAANTNVEQCEVDSDNCYRDNYLLTNFLAEICSGSGIKMVYISSTGVYGNHQLEPYREYSETRPTTHHHRAKLLGENSVRSASLCNLIVRIGWLFGGSFDNPKNFVARRIEEAVKAVKTGQIIHSNYEQIGCPTYSSDVAHRIMELIIMDSCGIYNLVNQGQATRLEYIEAICDFAGLAVTICPVNLAYFNRIANVSKNEVALNWRSNNMGLVEMPHWRLSLEKYIRNADI